MERPTGAKYKDPHEKQHKELLKAFETFRKVELREFRDYLAAPKKIILANFIAGTARGLGFFFGAAIVVAGVSFLLKEILANIPVIGDLSLALETWIEQTLESPN